MGEIKLNDERLNRFEEVFNILKHMRRDLNATEKALTKERQKNSELEEKIEHLKEEAGIPKQLVEQRDLYVRRFNEATAELQHYKEQLSARDKELKQYRKAEEIPKKKKEKKEKTSARTKKKAPKKGFKASVMRNGREWVLGRDYKTREAAEQAEKRALEEFARQDAERLSVKDA